MLHSKIEFLNINSQGYIEYCKKFYDLPKLGWENFHLTTEFHVVPVNGGHLTMMTEKTNRTLLGERITQSLLTVEYERLWEKK